MMSITGDDALVDVASEARQRLQRVVEALATGEHTT
jgi:hypothetical protein